MAPTKPLRIAVAGCGPAGMAVALLLARQGHDLRLFERFDQAKPVGSGLMLQPTGLAVLDRLGLAEAIRARGRRIDRLFGRAIGSGRVVLDVRYRSLDRGYAGLAVHRAALFGVLAEAVAKAGVAVVGGSPIDGLDREADGAFLRIGDRREGPFDLVIDAMGSRSPLLLPLGLAGPDRELAYGALWATLPWPGGVFDGHALEQRYHRASKMAGVLPLGSPDAGEKPRAAFFWSLRTDQYPAWRSAGLKAWKDEARRFWPETAPLLDTITDPDQLTLARYRHHTARGFVAERYAAIGDAAHAASPQLGQGANMALLDAFALARAIEHAPIEDSTDLAGALRRYEKSRSLHVRFFQGLSAAFTPFYQSDSGWLPAVRDLVAAPASRAPVARGILAAMVAGTLGWGLRPLGLEPYRIGADDAPTDADSPI